MLITKAQGSRVDFPSCHFERNFATGATTEIPHSRHLDERSIRSRPATPAQWLVALLRASPRIGRSQSGKRGATQSSLGCEAPRLPFRILPAGKAVCPLGRGKEKCHPKGGILFEAGAPGRIRTHDPLVRSQVLYPTELRALKNEL